MRALGLARQCAATACATSVLSIHAGDVLLVGVQLHALSILQVQRNAAILQQHSTEEGRGRWATDLHACWRQHQG